MGFGGGNTVGGYDVVGTGAVGDPTRGGQTIQDISAGSSDDDAYVAAIQANVDKQLAQQAAQNQQAVQNQQQALLAEQAAELLEQNRIQELANRMTSVNFSRTLGNQPISSLEQIAMRGGFAPMPSSQGLLAKMPSFPKAALGFVGQKAAGTMYNDIIENDYIPQYDAMGQIVTTINPKTGQFGAGSVPSRIDPKNPANIMERRRLEAAGVRIQEVPPQGGDDGGGYIPPEATAVAVAQPQEPSMVERDYIYPEGGFYPTTGRFYRPSLLDIAPEVYGGLLAGRTAPEFQEMNYAFRRPVDASMYQDPYNLAGYQPYPPTASLLG